MPNSSTQLAEAHEPRLQRLEGAMQEVATSTALTAQKLDFIAERVVEGFQNVNERLDKGAEQFDLQAAALAESRVEITKLRDLEHGRASRWAAIKKSFLPILAAGAGVLATRAGEALWIVVGRAFHH